MPLASIPVRQLRRLVSRDLGRDEIVTALEQLGCDIEGRALLTTYRCERCGQLTEVLEHEDFNNVCAFCGSAGPVFAGSDEVIRINLLPVRPDMMDPAGLARSLRGYLGIETGLPRFELRTSNFEVSVKPGLENIRPHIACCVVRGLAMDDETVKTLMKMQENLHWSLGRDRRRASIGVYDLGTVEPDFEYRPVKPDGVRFVPLFGMPEGMVAATPKEILARHPKGVGYRHLLERFEQYPLLCDRRGRVLSMPPVINSEETRVTEKTKSLFVDVTGPDRNAVGRALAVIAASLTELGGRVETVEIRQADGRTETTPDLTPGQMTIVPESVTRVLGFDVPDIEGCLGRMRYGIAERDKETEGQRDKGIESLASSLGPLIPRSLGSLSVLVPAYRSDIMHEYDIIEDVAIAYGYHNVKPALVPSLTVGAHQALEDYAETCRRAMTGLGFLEVMTLILTNPHEHYELLGLAVPERYCMVENPASVEQTMCREHLLAGLLATFRVNVVKEMPQQIFEVGDCFELDPKAETGVRVHRKLACGQAGPRVGFADVRSIVQTLGRELDLVLRWEPAAHPAMIPGRAARLICRRMGREFEWGVAGEVHPEVLSGFGIGQPVALVEVGIERLA